MPYREQHEPNPDDPLRLLLVEDDTVDAQSVRRLLRRGGLEADVTIVEDLAGARAALEEPRFDCVLLDHELPDGEGLQLLRELGESGGSPVPIVVLTGHDDESLAGECLQAGAQDYLTKGDYGSDALVRAIRYARERWRLLAQVQLRTRELQRSNVELEQFAYVASHDLQEPVRSIQSLSKLLAEHAGDALDAQGQEILGRLSGAAGRMRSLIRDLLALARVSRQPTALETVDLDALARTVAADIDLEGRGAELTIEGLEPVRGDPTQLRQLLQNLLGNALKFAREGEPARIEVRGKRIRLRPGSGLRAKGLLVTVRDEGIGFDAEQAERIFMAFKRLHPRDRFEGTGIGLAICKKIVEVHGGTIRAQGEPDKGATFSFTLVRAVPDSTSAER